MSQDVQTADPLDPVRLDRLAAAARDGDRRAFTTLMLDTHAELRAFLSVRIADPDLMDEIEQSTFVTCYQRLSGYELRGSFLSWLKGIARNLLLRELVQRSRRGARTGGDRLALREAQRGLDATPPEDGLERREAAGLVSECLEQLSQSARRLMAWRYQDDLSVAEIADRSGRTANWVAVNLHRIRQVLRDCLVAKGLSP